MKLGLKQTAIGIVALLVIIVIIVMIMPVGGEQVVASEVNSHIYALLVAGNIEEALVDSTMERTIVSYDLPANLEKEASWYYVIGVVASIAPETKRIELQAFENNQPTEQVTVQIADVLDLANNRTTEAQFRSKMEIKQV